jgi:hypothetical protein
VHQPLSAISVEQAGVFSREQAILAGYSPAQIRRRLTSGLWSSVARDVFRNSGTPVSARAVWHAALLQVGDSAVLCHQTAAQIWDIERGALTPVHVTAPHRVRNPGLAIVVHRGIIDGVRLHGLRVSGAAKTTIDMCRNRSSAERRAMFDEQLRAGTVTLAQLRRAALDVVGGRGTRGLLSDVDAVDPRLHSIVERSLQVALRESSIDPGVAQYPVRDGAGLIGHADRAWPSRKLIVEIDGYAWHSDRETFRADRRRQNRLVVAGWTVLRFTAYDVTSDSHGVVTQIARALREGTP